MSEATYSVSLPTQLTEAKTCSQGREWKGRMLSAWRKVGQSGSGSSMEWRLGVGLERGVGLG